jgi:hypothetical protein
MHERSALCARVSGGRQVTEPARLGSVRRRHGTGRSCHTLFSVSSPGIVPETLALLLDAAWARVDDLPGDNVLADLHPPVRELHELAAARGPAATAARATLPPCARSPAMSASSAAPGPGAAIE